MSYRLTFSIALLLMLVSPLRLNAADAVTSHAGYYEGTSRWGCEYFKDKNAMSMVMSNRGDFWFIVDDNGTIKGEGLAQFDYKFGIDWGINIKLGISLMRALGVDLSPNVSIELDPTTATQRFKVAGTLVGSTANIKIIWEKNSELKLNLVATMTGSLTAKGGAGSLGAKGQYSTVIKTIKTKPISPIGDDSVQVKLRKLSKYGPYAMTFKGENKTASIHAKVQGMVVQKIDFAAARVIAKLAADRKTKSSPPGRDGQDGGKGDSGGQGPPGSKGDKGDKGERGKDGRAAPAFQIRAGQFVTTSNRTIQVRFRKPLPNARYAVALTPGPKSPQRLQLQWSKKSASGFSVIVSGDRRSNETVTVDWVATPTTN